MAGGIAKNAQEGTRSEYLAQFLLSAFGTAIPVPHPEDSGIDLYCTLGRRIGKRFLVEDNYLVQIKSHDEPLRYQGRDEVDWLLSHNYPLFICVVNKKSAAIAIYQTIALSGLHNRGLDVVSLHLCEEIGCSYFPQVVNESDLKLFLGAPIVRISAIDLADQEVRERLTETLRSWVRLDQENIDLRKTGVTMLRVPNNWTTNQPVQALTLSGNFKHGLIRDEIGARFNDLLLKMLSQLSNQWVAKGDRQSYDTLTEFIRKFMSVTPMKDSFGARLIQFSINAGNAELGLPGRLRMFVEKRDSGPSIT